MGRLKKEKQPSETTEIDAILANLEKKYGFGRVLVKELIVVSTGSIQLNEAMGIGGTAVGKFVEIIGPESSGKSTLTLHQMKEYQKKFPSRKVALFDYEHAFDKKYAISIGVDVDNLLIYQPTTQESGYDMILGLVQSNLVSCIVIDSQTAATPKAVLEGDMGDHTIALQARNNSKFCMKIKGLLDNHQCSLFVISQTRDNIGGMGDPTNTTGGKAIRFYADVRWKLWKLNDKNNEQNKTTVDVIKNKLDSPFGKAEFKIKWGVGISREDEILDYAIDFDIIKQSGSWFSYGDEKLGQGSDNVIKLFNDNPELYEEIENKVLTKLGYFEEESLLEETNQEIESEINNQNQIEKQTEEHEQ